MEAGPDLELLANMRSARLAKQFTVASKAALDERTTTQPLAFLATTTAALLGLWLLEKRAFKNNLL